MKCKRRSDGKVFDAVKAQSMTEVREPQQLKPVYIEAGYWIVTENGFFVDGPSDKRFREEYGLAGEPDAAEATEDTKVSTGSKKAQK